MTRSAVKWNFLAECELDHIIRRRAEAIFVHRAAQADFNVRAGKAVCVILRRRPCFLSATAVSNSTAAANTFDFAKSNLDSAN
jgi:hypothetical protein